MKIELNSGEVVEGRILARSLLAMVVKTDSNKFVLISKYAVKDPKLFKFTEDNVEDV